MIRRNVFIFLEMLLVLRVEGIQHTSVRLVVGVHVKHSPWCPHFIVQLVEHKDKSEFRWYLSPCLCHSILNLTLQMSVKLRLNIEKI